MWNQAAEDVKVLLTTQYRSRSGIREVISTLFYDGLLSPGRTDASETVPFPCSLVWVDTNGVPADEVKVEQSLVNEREKDAILAVLDMLVATLPRPHDTSVAVICFYRAQQAYLDRVIRDFAPARQFKTCEVRTVHASQGGRVGCRRPFPDPLHR